jgi:Protein phosphatase 2C
MWKVLGASVTGRSHDQAGKACQDACGWRADSDRVCLAVADGAGSRLLSGTGAALAVEHSLRLLGDHTDCPQDPADRVRLVFASVRDEIRRLASAEAKTMTDYAATLAVAFITGQAVCIGQVGDTIAVIGHQGRYKTVMPAPPSEYVNETVFVTDDDYGGELRITVLKASDVDAVFLSTDGLRFKILADLATAEPFDPFFEDLQEYVRLPGSDERAIRSFLERLSDQSGDDKTLLSAVRTSPDRLLEQPCEPDSAPAPGGTPEASQGSSPAAEEGCSCW